MKNGFEFENQDGMPMVVAFSSVLYMIKSKTQGTAYFKPEDIGKDALYIRLTGGVGYWVIDKNKMESIWGEYRSWFESSK